LIPVIWTAVISFADWNGLKSPKFVGFDNYKLMLDDYMFWDAISNTFFYWVVSVVVVLLVATGIAVCLRSPSLKGRRFFSTVTFLPYVCASVAMGLIFGMLFDENAGFINALITSSGGTKIPWLTSSEYDRYPVVLLFTWRIIPWFTVIIYSGLLNIPIEYYEAAKVDGASPWQQFTKITLPLLENILFFCTITITVDVWKMFNESYTLHGPGSSNTSLFQLIYEYAFKTFKLGYASAFSMVLILILLIISLVQFKLRKRNGEI
jgi:ABC-type sugar transport system permease subunit